MKFRMLLIAALMVLVLSLGSTAFAQSYPVYCGELSESDCELLTNAASQLPESSNFALDGDFSVSAEGENVEFSIAARGGYVVNAAAFEGLVDPDLNKDPVAMMAFVESLTVDTLSQFVDTILGNFDAELFLSVNVPAEVSGGMVPETLDISLWLVDGVGYIDLGAFSFADPSLEGIYGLDLNEVAALAFTQITDEDLAGVIGMMMEGNPMMSSDAMAQFTDPSFMGEFATMKRLEDDEIDGIAVAVFETTIDYGAVFASDIMSDMMTEAMADEMPEDVTPEEMMAAFAEAFGDSTAYVNYMVGLDDGYMYGFSFSADFDIDPSGFEELEEGSSHMMATIQMSMQMDFMRFDIDAVEGIAAPDGATVVPLEDLMGGMGAS